MTLLQSHVCSSAAPFDNVVGKTFLSIVVGNQFSSVEQIRNAFTNKQKCNSTESFCTIFLANFEINFHKFTEGSKNSTTKVSVQLEKTKNPPKLHLSRAEIKSI